MTKRKAIRTLKNHFEKLNSITDHNAWISELAEYCRLFFGESSQTVYHLRQRNFLPYGHYTPEEIKTAREKKDAENKEYLESLVRIIKINGLYKASNSSFLSKWSNWEIIIKLSPIAIAFAGISFTAGRYFLNNEMTEKQRKYDSVLISKTLPVLNHTKDIPKGKADTANNTN